MDCLEYCLLSHTQKFVYLNIPNVFMCGRINIQQLRITPRNTWVILDKRELKEGITLNSFTKFALFCKELLRTLLRILIDLRLTSQPVPTFEKSHGRQRKTKSIWITVDSTDSGERREWILLADN